MIEVVLGENDDVERAIREFRRKVVRSGHMKDIRRKRYYEKPSEARRRKAKEARARALRAQERLDQFDWP